MNKLIRILFMGIAVATQFYSCGKENLDHQESILSPFGGFE